MTGEIILSVNDEPQEIWLEYHQPDLPRSWPVLNLGYSSNEHHSHLGSITVYPPDNGTKIATIRDYRTDGQSLFELSYLDHVTFEDVGSIHPGMYLGPVITYGFQIENVKPLAKVKFSTEVVFIWPINKEAGAGIWGYLIKGLL